MASSEHELYANTDAIMQHRKNRQQPNPVLRPQCLGQEDQQGFYENRDSLDLSSDKYGDGGQEQYEIMDTQNDGGQQQYEALDTTQTQTPIFYEKKQPDPVPKNQRQAATNQAAAPPTRQRAVRPQPTRGRPNSEVVPRRENDDFYDDVTQHPTTSRPSELNKKKQASSGSKYAEKIEMKNLNEIQKKADEIVKRDRQQGGKIWFCIYLVPVGLIIAVAALVLAILLVSGVIKNKDCACSAEIDKLKIQVAHLRSQHASPATVPTSFSITPTSRFTPSPSRSPSRSPVKTVLPTSSSESIVQTSIVHTLKLLSIVSARNSTATITASTSVV